MSIESRVRAPLCWRGFGVTSRVGSAGRCADRLRGSQSTDPQERARQRVLVEQRVATECSDKEGWFTATLRTSEDDGSITWRICLLGPVCACFAVELGPSYLW